MDLELAGKVVLVTGSGKGLGKELARRFAGEGARVVINARTRERVEAVAAEIRQSGGEALAVPGDVSDATVAAEVVARIKEAWGRLDVLVNNAGINRDAFLTKMTDEQWLEVINTNLNGTFFITREVAKLMQEHNYGRIISISSIVLTGNRGTCNYSATKAALEGFTRSIALELARYNVTANCVAPGYIRTDMYENISEKVKEKIHAAIPVGRVAEPDEIADAVLFLASERARYITGVTLFVDGGTTVGYM